MVTRWYNGQVLPTVFSPGRMTRTASTKLLIRPFRSHPTYKSTSKMITVMKQIFLILFVAVSIPAFSQSYTSFQYSMGFGTGDLGDFIGSPSFRGFTIDYRGLVRPEVGIGVDIGWN